MEFTIEELSIINKLAHREMRSECPSGEQFKKLNMLIRKVLRLIKGESSNYRIKEYDGKFWIQVRVTETTKTGLFKNKIKETEVWCNVDKYGYPSIEATTYDYCNEIEPFDSIEQAKAKIEVFKKGVIYHY